MRTTLTPAVPEQVGSALPGEVLTRRAVTVITASIVLMTFAFSLGNVTRLCLGLGITVWIAWLVGPAVDLSVVGLLTGMRFLSLHGYADAQLARLRRMLRLCGLLTLALNTAGAIGHRQYGTALVDAVGPVLLILWAEAGPWLLRQIHAVCPPAAPRQAAAPQQPEAAPAPPPVLSAGLLARTRELDAEHRARPAGPSRGTPSAPGCGSAGAGPGRSWPLSAPRRPPGPGRAQPPRQAAWTDCRCLSRPDPASCR